MKEIMDIVKAYDRLMREGSPFVLATVVGASGSTYRRPGARMLFSEAGRAAGLINAACFEADLLQRAREVLRSGGAKLVTYDATSSADVVFGLGLGCKGAVEILLEPSAAQTTGKKLELFRECVETGKPVVVATVIDGGARKDPAVGDFLALNGKARAAGTIQDSRLSSSIEADATRMSGQSFARKTYSYEMERVEVFLEKIVPPLPLLIFGAGPDAVPLVDAAKLLGWHVTVIDHRPAYANKSAFPQADSVLLSDQVPRGLEVNDRHAAVIMTHNFDRDRSLLPILLGSAARYVGLLGPRSKLNDLLHNLEESGFRLGKSRLDKLHAPIGLDIGAETPEEIALSIVAEIKAAIEGRGGGSLKNRAGTIHGE
jgi:xanthine dehydrogenase accessory factor